jgi:hypothetical protein
MVALKALVNLFGKKPVASGLTIMLLQHRLERFSTERLQVAMERGWRRQHDPVSFFATSLDGEGAILKLGKMFITMLYSDRRVGKRELGFRELPLWADHSAHVAVMYKCPGGIPEGEMREQIYGLLGLLAAELLDKNVSAILFLDEQIVLPNTRGLGQSLRSGGPKNPAVLREMLSPAN